MGAIRRHAPATESFADLPLPPSPEARGRVAQLWRWLSLLPDMGGETGESLEPVRTRVLPLHEVWSKP